MGVIRTDSVARVNRNHQLTRTRRLSQAFRPPAGGGGNQVFTFNDPFKFIIELAPDPAANTDRQAMCVKLASSNAGIQQIAAGVRNNTGYLEISNSAGQLFWRVDVNSMRITHNTSSTSCMANIVQAGSGDASMCFTLTGVDDWSVGIDNSDGDAFKISKSSALGTDDAVTINSARNVHVSVSASVASSLTVDNATATMLQNDTGTDTMVILKQSGTGDASLGFVLTSVDDWSIGIDNSDSDGFKISRSSVLGTNDAVIINSARNVHSVVSATAATASFGSSITVTSSVVNVNGSWSGSILVVTANTTLGNTHFTLLSNAAVAALTHTLPAANTCTGRVYNIKRLNAGINAVTIAAAVGDTIDGVGTRVLGAQFESVTIQSGGGTAWHIL
jgi:hypothetical protein